MGKPSKFTEQNTHAEERKTQPGQEGQKVQEPKKDEMEQDKNKHLNETDAEKTTK